MAYRSNIESCGNSGILESGLWDFGAFICVIIHKVDRLSPTAVRSGAVSPPWPLKLWQLVQPAPRKISFPCETVCRKLSMKMARIAEPAVR